MTYLQNIIKIRTTIVGLLLHISEARVSRLWANPNNEHKDKGNRIKARERLCFWKESVRECFFPYATASLHLIFSHKQRMKEKER